ncbi:M20/M25/M40 family metallo-hydrolase [Oceanobacillus luteolus]|uniref:M20/M25/M40 family metallo-hydrolase n=1 Tax=Oceanobacillus luteolus TaxID=1274358 RepID=A0ABW4HWF4_9BACI|nr:M20/M25/M40 family metallo-hydrolase [Oceanobacillus luteolus]MCM3740853.1 M20/M25/M40 family metallo-hydrolase [Oceanobacillus luteolus]
MLKARWGTPKQLRDLLNELVSWNSITLSEGERQFPIKLENKLRELAYFQKHPEYLTLHDTDDQRQFLTALYKHPDAQKTICLVSHFDTVNIEEYGKLKEMATEPDKLTEILKIRAAEFSADVRNDLASGEYLFGRGTMDMKMGLALHMQMLERASLENWPINLLLLTVPDEEVNSAGMRSAVPALLKLEEKHELNYILFLNSEPVFTQHGDDTHYIYSGSIGKVMPAALFYGKETHAGQPLNGMTSPYIASYLTQEMEWNSSFQETSYGETNPLPVTLQQRDLKSDYSTQTPYRSSALYNVLVMEQTAADVFDRFEQVANKAAVRLNRDYAEICRNNQVDPVGKVSVIRYEQLETYAVNKLGREFIDRVKATVHHQKEWDDREKSLRIADKLMIECQELAPAIVILLTPPYYPAVNSSDNETIENCVAFVKRIAKEKFNLKVERVHYFNGICDLSYVSYEGDSKDSVTFEANTPVWETSYSIPFEDMLRLDAPVLNIGPFGKDAHKLTERLHIKNAFEEMPVILKEMIQQLSLKNKVN